MTTTNWEDAFDCLRAPERRAVLLTLHERSDRRYLLAGGTEETGTSGRATEEELSLADVDAKLDAARMYHVHLPKMAEPGYVEYSDDGERVAPGDSFEEIRPLLDVLDENEDALPGIAG